MEFESKLETARFHSPLKDGEIDEQEIEVRDDAPPPDMLREGIGALVEGTLSPEGYFVADRLLVKHSNEYRAPVDGEHVEDVYKSVEGL